MDWTKELQTAQQLQPAHRRRVYATDKYVIRVTLKPGELDEFGSTHDYTHTILQDENLVLATNLVKSHTTVPVPAVVHFEEGLTVLEMKEGIDLEQA